jgi:hypothetical protein
MISGQDPHAKHKTRQEEEMEAYKVEGECISRRDMALVVVVMLVPHGQQPAGVSERGHAGCSGNNNTIASR